ncbi:hypothetical protein Tco_0785195 [Tanacetum coccineum]
MAPLPPRAQRHLWLRYQVEGYTEEMVQDFEQRLDTIFGRHVNRVHVLDFVGLTEEIGETLANRMSDTKLRYVVPTGRVKVPADRYVVPTGKDNVIVSAG